MPHDLKPGRALTNKRRATGGGDWAVDCGQKTGIWKDVRREGVGLFGATRACEILVIRGSNLVCIGDNGVPAEVSDAAKSANDALKVRDRLGDTQSISTVTENIGGLVFRNKSRSHPLKRTLSGKQSGEQWDSTAPRKADMSQGPKRRC